jgi:hypothetical protein
MSTCFHHVTPRLIQHMCSSPQSLIVPSAPNEFVWQCFSEANLCVYWSHKLSDLSTSISASKISHSITVSILGVHTIVLGCGHCVISLGNNTLCSLCEFFWTPYIIVYFLSWLYNNRLVLGLHSNHPTLESKSDYTSYRMMQA